MVCKYCLDCTVDEELTPDNDFSSFSIGCFQPDRRLMLTVSNGESLVLEYEEWDPIFGEWRFRGCYSPKYCPECGRKIV